MMEDFSNNPIYVNTKKKITGKNDRNYLNFNEKDQMEIYGYKNCFIKRLITWCFYLLTFGVLRLIYHWYPHIHLKSTHIKCNNLNEATHVLIIDNYKGKFKTYFVEKIKNLQNNKLNQIKFNLDDGTVKSLQLIRTIHVKKLIYIWDDDKGKFQKLAGLDKGLTYTNLKDFKGYTEEEQRLKRIIYGNNEIIVPVQSILTLLILEALTPFYIFQVFSLILWFAELYYYYTIAILIMSIFGITTSIIQTRKNQKNLKGTVNIVDKIKIKRPNGTFNSIPTTDLVPGDIIMIPSYGCIMHCDAILLNGNCIVNESMLTGESVPITKTPLPTLNEKNKFFHLNTNTNNHILYCGTKIIQTRYYNEEYVLALVIRTGYLTTKGELVRSIMYPPPADFKFDQDSYKFILILSVIAICGCVYTIFSKFSRNINFVDVIIKALDLITIAVPPALPAAMTVGKLYALNHLKKSRIFCINSRVINVSGSINCICFDKTGTLTEDGLDMWGIVAVDNNKTQSPVNNCQDLPPNCPLIYGMASCHSLTIINDELCGDPLDIKMFEFTQWSFEEPIKNDDLLAPIIVRNSMGEEIGIVHQNQFSSNLQRMSVITKRSKDDFFMVYCKGAPETILSLSDKQSVPLDIMESLKMYTQQGYRVIALGQKKIYGNYHKIVRDDIENNLDFMGLIILENRLKPQTIPVIDTLKRANMKIVMITGDNIQTAMSVALECGIINQNQKIIIVNSWKESKTDLPKISFLENTTKISLSQNQDVETCEINEQFAINGQCLNDIFQYFPEMINQIIGKGVVFARMSGQQKQQIIEELQNLGYYVAMCGDGANDCGALKGAHVGISLSTSESSVASPFTSCEANINCVPKIIKEGRAALVTSFGVFKFMICYSLTEFTSALILYSIDSNLTSLQFLFIDICLILNFASFFGKTDPYNKLNKNPPMTSLLSFIPLLSISLFMLNTIFFQLFSFIFIQTYPWFEPFIFDPKNTTQYNSYENYAVFTISMFQYITMAIIFSKGKPFRQPLYKNIFFLLSLIIMFVICTIITVIPPLWLSYSLELKIPPTNNVRLIILFISIINFLICIFIEDLFVDFICLKLFNYFKLKKSKNRNNKISDKNLNFIQLIDKKCNVKNGIDNVGFIENITK